MKGIKWFFFSVLVALLFVCQSSFALPFSITPAGTLPTTVDNVSDATAYYTVRNTTTQAAPASFVKFLPQNVKQIVDKTQPSLCGAVFNLAPNAYCILALNVSGPVNARDPNPEHHLFVCRAGGKTCAGTAFELNVTQVTLVSIIVSPTAASKAIGLTQQYAATGTFSDGSTRSLLTYNVTWDTSNHTVATIDSTGLALAKATGTAVITASLGGITSPTSPSPPAATLTVTPAAVTNILITPAPTVSVPRGTTLQFRAIATFTDGTTADITSLSTTDWDSTTTSTATIGLHTGLADAIGTVGSTTDITAASGSITSDPTTLTVDAATLQCITVTPDPGNVAATGDCAPGVAGANCLAFTAMGTYSDSPTPVDIRTSVTWASSNSSNASISNAGGTCPGSTCTGTAKGLIADTTTNITASLSGITSNDVLLTVSRTLLSIAVTPSPMVIYVGENFQFTATGTYDSGPTVPITTSVGWGSSNPGVATVGTTGLATAVAAGTTNIMAAMDSVSGSADLTVNDQVLYAGLFNTNVCISSNGGISWGNCVIPDGLPIVDMASAIGSIYAVTSGAACYNRNDLSWFCPTVLVNPTAITALSSTFVYAGFISGGISFVSVSSNDGVTFDVPVALPATNITSLAVTDETNLYAGMSDGSVCKSLDNGGTWPSCVATTLFSVRALTVDRNSGHVYAGGNVAPSFAGQVCVSTNGGVIYSCSTLINGLVTTLAATTGYVYAGTNAGTVCVSTDNGATFPTCNQVVSPATGITRVVIDRYGSVFASTGAGAVPGRVCRSYDHGATWPSSLCQIVNASSPVTGLAITQP